MTIKRPTLALILCALLFALVGWAAGRSTARVQWEYKYTCDISILQNYGDDGWEMVAAADRGAQVCVFFKRQK